MSKGDTISVKTGSGDESIQATTNGSSVVWEAEKDRATGVSWITLTEMSKAGKTVRTMKFKMDYVFAIIERPAKPV